MIQKNLKTTGFAVVLMLATGLLTPTAAQQMRGMQQGQIRMSQDRPARNLNLTDEQQKQMKDLGTQFQNEMRQAKNQLQEKQAHLKTLIDMDNRDKKDLDKTIADLTALKGEMMKKGIAHRDAVKAILTPEQMNIWENHSRQRMERGQRGNGQPGMHPGRNGLQGRNGMQGRDGMRQGKAGMRRGGGRMIDE